MSSVDDNDTDFPENPPTKAETLRFIKLLTRIGPEERR